MNLHLVILIALIFAALWTVMTRSLIRSAIGLALTSAILTIVMFALNAPLAAVFELSVCAGLISVLFVSTISLTHPLSRQEILQHMKDRLTRFWYLPILVAVCAIILSALDIKFSLKLPAHETENDVRVVLWNLRQFDILGQIIVLLSGVFGVVILFREKNKK
ncbi:MAG: hypothetical protein PHT31_05935 [Candidatus Omnitrophica bacterium]|nr:hypothetical protein [Candidatus Omnitrophota bacterium]MDD5653678.1 hypothetical protein [Candidatus Omnitrophota bacterium]